jgi:hypothetical protein
MASFGFVAAKDGVVRDNTARRVARRESSGREGM